MIKRPQRVPPATDDANVKRLAPPIVGIGASAGGLESFVQLMSHLETNSGLAYVLVQHLDPSHESTLPEILARVGKIPVVVATDGVRLEGDTAYVIPRNSSMTVTDGHLRVVTAERVRGVQTVIDGFLQSLAAVQGIESIGVILSGSGSDGSAGIEAIKQEGGITLAQDPETAQYPSMPDSAIATGCIDFVLSPEQIAGQLALIARHLAVRPGSAAASADDADVQTILAMLRSRTGTDFRSYRRATVHRRILRRMVAHRAGSHAEYLEHLRAHPEDLDILHQDLLIGVTRFFRDPDTFAELQSTAFSEMMTGRAADAPIRAWVAGCSTGEEAYSLAISLIEFAEETNATATEIHVFATDINEQAIAQARAGLYPETITADVSPARLARFFTKEATGGYRVVRRVRDLCVFAMQNIVRDPPFSQLDLISCRNVLIYFEPSLQARVIPMFHYALKPTGVLLLGAAESVGSSTFFTAFDKSHRIFKPQDSGRRGDDAEQSNVFPLPRTAIAQGPRRELPTPDVIRHDADREVLARFGPPGVVINDRLEITQFRGDTTGLIQHNPGVASLDLFKLVRPELVPRLRSAIEKARASDEMVREEQVAIREAGITRAISFEVIPFRSGSARERFLVVVFDASPSPRVVHAPVIKRPRRGTKAFAIAHDSELAGLRDELSEAKRYLQDIIDQYEGANEELRAANEEIQSSNEELQSTSEELETTKEEIESTNEELTTINEELRYRNRELAAASADVTNVFASTQIPMLIVDGDLLVRRFTPITEQVIRIIPTDIGRPLGDLRLRVALFDLEARVIAAITTFSVEQLDVQDDQQRWWSLTIRPYLTAENRVDGALLVFTDIDATKKYGQRADETSENQRMLLLEAESGRIEANVANFAKGSFLANMSHDLRTPLNAIAGYADLLELHVHGPLTPSQENDVRRIKRSAKFLLLLINDILNFSKLDRGALNLQIDTVGVDGALAALESMIYPQLMAKGLTFEHQVCAAFVRADPEKLQQILLNLMSNAIKFTVAGGIIIRCTHGDTDVNIQIADTGIGIAANQLERIFDPFVQVNQKLSIANSEGVGLGLAISRDLARAMGGDLTARSTLGEGSVFALTLPRADWNGVETDLARLASNGPIEAPRA